MSCSCQVSEACSAFAFIALTLLLLFRLFIPHYALTIWIGSCLCFQSERGTSPTDVSQENCDASFQVSGLAMKAWFWSSVAALRLPRPTLS